MLLLAKLKISGHSMEPQIKNGKQILVSNIPYMFRKPLVNDIVAFRLNNKILIKRIYKIFKNNYFLKGDNSSDSFDSRTMGYIKKDRLMGKVIHILK